MIPSHDTIRAGLSRREFLAFTAGSLLFGCSRSDGWPRIGLALGGGGAKGLAHIPLLEAFDELGIRPHRIAGTSIGAIIGALYAGGKRGADIRALVEQFLMSSEPHGEETLFRLPRSLRWLDFLDPAGSGGLLDSTDFIAFVGETLGVDSFRQLRIPLRVTTADLWSGAPVVLDSGPLLPALQASMALPGVFPPVEVNGRVLVDGGVADPLPYDLLLDDCDVVVAIDVSGDPNHDNDGLPSFLGVLFHSFHTMSGNILREKLRQRRPHIYIRPEIQGVRVLEFYKAEQVFEQARPARRELVRALERARGGLGVRPGCALHSDAG